MTAAKQAWPPGIIWILTRFLNCKVVCNDRLLIGVARADLVSPTAGVHTPRFGSGLAVPVGLLAAF